MARRKSFGNPLTKLLGEALDKVAPEVVDGLLDVATGPKKGGKKDSSSSASDTTDWHTRGPGATRKKR
jgi:hypothetical protein